MQGRTRGGVMGGVVLSALLAAPFLPDKAVAGNQHVGEAISHATEAGDHGEMGHSDAIVMHAQVALNHAKMAQKDTMNPHLDEGVRELEEAIAHGNQGHAGVATRHAKSAEMHLSKVS